MPYVSAATFNPFFDRASQALRTALLSKTPKFNRSELCLEISEPGIRTVFPLASASSRWQRWLGDKKFTDLVAYSITLESAPYHNSFAVDEAVFTANKNAQLAAMSVFEENISKIASSADDFKSLLFANALEAGDTKTYHDNVSIYSASHPVSAADPSVKTPSGSTTQSNLLTSSALSAETLKTAVATMRKFCDDSGLFLHLTPRYLIVPPALELLAWQLTVPQTIALTHIGAGTATGNVNTGTSPNALAQFGIKPVVVPYLTSDTTWYLGCEEIPQVIINEFEAPTVVQYVGKDSPSVFYKGQVQVSGTARWGALSTVWPSIIKCTA